MDRESLQIERLLGVLVDYDVAFVLVGSVAVEAWGVDIGPPGDLDIIPATDLRNLRRLSKVLKVIEAKPVPLTGEWQLTADGFRWHEFDDNDPRRRPEGATPDPADPASYDSLFATKYGAFDVVPMISG